MVGRFPAKLGPKTYRVRLENTVPNEPGISPGVQLYLTPRRDHFLIGHPTRPKLKTQTASCEDDFKHLGKVHRQGRGGAGSRTEKARQRGVAQALKDRKSVV